ncbi:biliverdin-producing heme oxygenase [Chitinimonas lacunae]|uniref:Biliverdin-producing heme oxygenase n=1 Tax=Chitinimonas lacunae TaxID=1963018 RepID=A0ABV8MLA2_9NEIS
MISTASDPLHYLRETTATLHQRFDSALPIAREDAGLSDYLAHLRAMRRWLDQLSLVWEQADSPAWQPMPAAIADRLALIDADLGEAGETPLPAAPCPPAPANNEAFLWGVAYVAEGSRLGGLVLHRRLAAQLAPHPLRFLCAGNDWPRFIAALRAADPARKEARAGALWAFAQAGAAHGLALDSPS